MYNREHLAHGLLIRKKKPVTILGTEIQAVLAMLWLSKIYGSPRVET